MVSGGAQPAVESFDAGANGWAGSSELFTGSWNFSGGTAEVVFSDIGSFAFPDIGVLSAAAGATSGSFTGDYDAASIEAIGFSFRAQNVLPGTGTVELEWGGSASVYRRGFPVTETGVWFRFVASLSEADKSQWTVKTGSLDDFAAARQSVDQVTLRVPRKVTSEHRYSFDEIFVAGLPEGGSVTAAGARTVVWQGLLSGVRYEVERTTNLVTGIWSFYEQIQATGAFRQTIVTNSADPAAAFRMRFQ
jgi:hypothetical protein